VGKELEMQHPEHMKKSIKKRKKREGVARKRGEEEREKGNERVKIMYVVIWSIFE
jgi:hypothetical protein